jgi:hypothetical protein
MEATHHDVTVIGKTTRRADASGRLDLDALAARNVAELGALYAAAARPTQVDTLAGNPRGRMLAVRTLDEGAPAGAIRSLASAAFFPWGGKSFAGAGASGTGVNRVHLLGRHALFPFHTRLAPSVVDGAPCVMLDYDLPDNPLLIRKIHDEVREVTPGLWLGPAMWKGDGAPALVLWFALDTRVQALPVGHGRDPR